MTAQTLTAFGVLLFSLLLAPLLSGIINRVKAKAGGRRGRPLLQLYFDLRKLLIKKPVYSHTTSWFFRAAPVTAVAASLTALLFLPFGNLDALLSFPGDFAVLSGLLALSRFMLILAALDTGSAFEGMGAAREGLISALAEPIFLFCLAVLAYQSQTLSLSGMLGAIHSESWLAEWPFYLMLSFALFLLLLPENCRIPVDDPNTHLELTMIHEVMILDHSGPDLALLEYASALKLWIFALLIAGVLLPAIGDPLFAVTGVWAGSPVWQLGLSMAVTLAVIFSTAVLVGLVESAMARFRMERVPQILTLAGSFACLAALSLWR